MAITDFYVVKPLGKARAIAFNDEFCRADTLRVGAGKRIP